MHKISVIIPVYNRTFELQRAIRSVLLQTYKNLEIIVVDDCSDINVKHSLAEFNATNLKYFRLEKKSNANVCRNLGINNASGDYIAMLDSDDEWLPEHIDRKLNYLIKTGADGVFGSYVINDGIEKRNVISRSFETGESMVNYILSDGSVATPTHFYKTECVRKIMWDESLIRHQDYDFSVRFSKLYKFIPSAEITCVVHWRKNEKRLEDFPSMIKFIDKNKYEIKNNLFCQYHRRIYTAIVDRPDVDIGIKEHYKVNSIKFMNVLSLSDYISTFGINKSLIYRLYLRFEYYIKKVIV